MLPKAALILLTFISPWLLVALMFGGAGLVTLILTWRLVVQKASRAGG